MARMTASDLVTFVRKGMGNPTTDEWTDTEILRFINLAQVRIAETHKPPEVISSTTITTTSGTYDYELTATDVIEITDVRNSTDGLRMKKGCLDDWLRDEQNSSISTGTVQRYIEFGIGANSRPNLRLWQCPDGTKTITVYYIKKPTELVTSPAATSSILREQWDEYILKAAVEIGLELDQQRQAAAYARQMSDEVEKRAKGLHKGTERKWSNTTRVAGETQRRTGR